MAKAVDKKKNKYKKIKQKYKNLLSVLTITKESLLNKLDEMEIYFLDKTQFYKKLYLKKIKELEEDNENINSKYLNLLNLKIDELDN